MDILKFNLNEEIKIQDSKKELKNILNILISNGEVDYDNPNFNKLNKRRKDLENILIKFDKSKNIELKPYRKFKLKDDKYPLGSDIYGIDRHKNKSENGLVKSFLDIMGNDDVVKYSDYTKSEPNKNDDYTKDTGLPKIDNIYNGDKPYEFDFKPNKKYDISDIVNIIFPNAKIKAVYMGLCGMGMESGENRMDVQNILDKRNPEFEKSDPFDGVFVLFTENLPHVIDKKGVRIFLIDEKKVGKGKQKIKAYENDGKFATYYNVNIKDIELEKKQEIPHKIAASLRIPDGPSLLEKINSKEFIDFINQKLNETLLYENFNHSIDFEEVIG